MTAKLFLEDSYRKNFKAKVTAVSGHAVQLDRTLFYATSGGQPGDCGALIFSNQNIPIIETKKGETPDEIWHILPEDSPLPTVEDVIEGSIAWDRRYAHMRMHTALHLLCALIEGDVTGGQIGADKSRLDFNISADAVDKDDLTRKLNDLISQDHPVSTLWISDADLAANPGLVRTMSVKPPMGSGKVRLVQIGKDAKNPVDLQPCGGTHVNSTGEIGQIIVTKIENKGKQNRRITLAFA